MYAYVHCGEGGEALEILQEMNEAGFAPAMTVSEVLLKVVTRHRFGRRHATGSFPGSHGFYHVICYRVWTLLFSENVQ